jgi:hypothetical protein
MSTRFRTRTHPPDAQGSAEFERLRSRIRELETQALFWENQCRTNLRIIESLQTVRPQQLRSIA